MLTIATAENSKINHGCFCLISVQYPSSKSADKMEVTIYIADMVAFLLPTSAHPLRERSIKITLPMIDSFLS